MYIFVVYNVIAYVVLCYSCEEIMRIIHYCFIFKSNNYCFKNISLNYR